MDIVGMNLRQKIYVVFAIFVTVSLSGVLFSPLVSGSAKDDVCQGVGLAGGGTGCTDPAGSTTVEGAIGTVVNILSILVGVAAVIMIIIAGFRFITAGGDSNSIASARTSIIYALVGLVVVALAQTIVRFVLNRV